jgi:hypothetical protein
MTWTRTTRSGRYGCGKGNGTSSEKEEEEEEEEEEEQRERDCDEERAVPPSPASDSRSLVRHGRVGEPLVGQWCMIEGKREELKGFVAFWDRDGWI